jgi:hypothetical protein
MFILARKSAWIRHENCPEFSQCVKSCAWPPTPSVLSVTRHEFRCISTFIPAVECLWFLRCARVVSSVLAKVLSNGSPVKCTTRKFELYNYLNIGFRCLPSSCCLSLPPTTKLLSTSEYFVWTLPNLGLHFAHVHISFHLSSREKQLLLNSGNQRDASEQKWTR